MLSLSVFGVLFSVFLCSSAVRGSLSGNRISVGNTVTDEEFTFQATILRGTNGSLALHCGGVIVSERHVLTSATCAQDLAVPTLRISAGGSVVEVKRTKIHESFAQGQNDIAVVEIVGSFDPANTSQIALDDELYDDEREVIALGYSVQTVSGIRH